MARRQTPRSHARPDKITEPRDAWQMDDAQAEAYYALLDTAHAAHGFNIAAPGYCPLLIAEHAEIKIGWDICDAAEYITGITRDQITATLKFREYLDLVAALVMNATPTSRAVRPRTAVRPPGSINATPKGTPPMFTLLFEILDPPDPTPRKRYLFCNDPRHPAQVTACDPMRARSLAALLSHPEIVVTVIEYASAASIYAAIETTTPSRETQANGHPRQYDPNLPADLPERGPRTYAVPFGRRAASQLQAIDAASPQ